MVIYKCPKCDKVFNRKSNYEYHVNEKKKPCTKDKGYICKKCGNEYEREISLKIHKKRYCNKKKVNNSVCEHCGQRFAHKTNYYRHMRANKCRISTINKSLGPLIENATNTTITDKKIEVNIQVINNSGKIINSNICSDRSNITNNVKLVAFGKENLYKMYTQEEAIKYMSRGFRSIYCIVNDTHFSLEKKEHHNIYISNMRDVYAKTFNGRRWELVIENDVIDQLFDDNYCYLVDIFRNVRDKLEDRVINKFSRFMDNSDEEVTNGLKKEIKMLLYNKRHIPIRTMVDSKK